MNRVQFQSGLSMAELMDRYGSDDKCEAALVESRWPEGFACPKCGCDQSNSFRRGGLLYFRCVLCRFQCNVLSGAIFEATKLPLSRWCIASGFLTMHQPRSPGTTSPPWSSNATTLGFATRAPGSSSTSSWG